MSTKLKVEDLRPEGSDYEISLPKLLGKQVKDIKGYITKEFGDPVFQLTWIVFNDGTEVNCEGEHDLPYVVQVRDTNPNLDDEVLNDLYDQENPDDDEDEDEEETEEE
jgi:hypothetical protein